MRRAPRTGAALKEPPGGAPAKALDFHWLTDALAIGGAFQREAVSCLAREHAITHVVDLREETRDDEAALRRHGIRLLHLPTPDACAISPDKLADGVAWVARALAARRRVLVHCEHGIGRSALLGLCVLVEAGMSPIEAMVRAKNARDVVSPSPAQLRAFIAFADRRQRSRSNGPAPSFDALAAIAYRHLSTPGESGPSGGAPTPQKENGGP